VAFHEYAAKGWLPARLIRDNKITYGALMAGAVEMEVVLRGKVYHEADSDAELPAVGAPASAEALTPIRSGRWMSE
jgi:ribosome biogenesis GTPase